MVEFHTAAYSGRSASSHAQVGDAAVFPAHTWSNGTSRGTYASTQFCGPHTPRPIYASRGGALIETDSTPSPRRSSLLAGTTPGRCPASAILTPTTPGLTHPHRCA
nr:hypothetical protein PDK3.088 [Rhodococcus sp. DK17]